MAATRPLVLASASPRRQELLASMGVVFTTLPADINETPEPNEDALQYVMRMAREKARAVRQVLADESTLVLASDTSVVLDGAILGKPESRAHAKQMLQALSGRGHNVMTAIALEDSRGNGALLASEAVVTTVLFTQLTEATIEAYLNTDEPWDKAGAYGIQGVAGAFVKRIEGSYSNVVGLPLAETRAMLVARGVATLFDAASSK